MKKYLLELLPGVSYYAGHALICGDIAKHIAMFNGNPKPNGLDIECMFKFDFHDAYFTGKWLGNTIYEFGHKKTNGKFVTYGRIYEINL